ncbi:O-fucosyltransferase 16 [Turnera subulata]|uniref:O-fucosyltransferase family protein n=1 Tax=Turnera subulata TaxID=218843 RepID=A0A9Q0JMG8_9ROSI|nr:O-fucosyltransferase 16 [Turnera subulata]
MKRKKARDHTITAVLHHIFLMRHRLFPLISVLSGCCLLLFAVVCLLYPLPPIVNHHHLRLFPHLQYSSLSRYGVTEESSFSRERTEFRVPGDGGNLGRDLWSSRLSEFYYGCSNASNKFPTADMKTNPDWYLSIATSGGLNQQRTGITDAVVAAYILNATLVVPKLDQKSYWNDSSNFADIFDVDWFIASLSRDVNIIKQLPTKHGKTVTPHRMRVPRKCSASCYHNRVLPVLIKKRAVQLGKFDYRLSNRLEPALQKLRCRVNYHALRFTNSIHKMGKMLVERMRMKSEHFITLHLRFEPDMLAFSGCYYGGGQEERTELGAIRKRWKTLHASNPDKERRHGRCPLTPEEVGLMLRALGFGSDVHIYVASGEVYGGEETLAPLKSLFPNFHTKETLATKEELAPFFGFSSRMAALDFIVCDESDVFVTNNNGNMAKMLAGRRRYFGHKPTIRPNAKKLYKLFMARGNMTWEEFASRVRTHQIGFMGEPNEVKPGRGEFHENPSSCICEDYEAKARAGLNFKAEHPLEDHRISEENDKRNGTVDSTSEQLAEDDHEQDLSDMDYVDNGMGGQLKGVPGEMYMESGLMPKVEPVELEAFFSD